MPPEDNWPPSLLRLTDPTETTTGSGLTPPEDEDATSLSKGSPFGTPVSEGAVATASLDTRSTGPAEARGRESGNLTFLPDDIVANRYKVIGFVGQGGMGEVYEVEDLELHEVVALKTIRPEIASDERATERFKREIQLARKVTHPNVCRVFDLGFHRKTAPAGDVTFLTMELLRGETLAGCLHRVGPMGTSDALPIVAQMAEALSAAHSAGIVHRDFKSANVMLVPVKDEPGKTRAVVTDFGLARPTTAGQPLSASLSASGDLLGTPTYMAPEQVRGEPINAAADIYALGVVMYEMVTGTHPFVGDTPLAVAVKRLEEPPSSPRVHVPDLDANWEAVILRCLELDPGDRYSSAANVAKALSGVKGAFAGRGLRGQKDTRRRFDLSIIGQLSKFRVQISVGIALAALVTILPTAFYYVLRPRPRLCQSAAPNMEAEGTAPRVISEPTPHAPPLALPAEATEILFPGLLARRSAPRAFSEPPLSVFILHGAQKTL